MVSEWRECCLGELAEIYDGPHATPSKTEKGPIFLGISNLNGGRLDLSNTEHLSQDDYQKWTRRVTPQTNDIVFSYETRLGEAALIPSGLKCCLGRRMGLLRPIRELVDSRFLLYAYLDQDFQETLRAHTIHGSTVDRIPLMDMPKFPISVPCDIHEQRTIAHILGTLDDKIELNRRMNETLEAMARAIFKSWFVDFDPVRAKAEGRDTGLPKEIADLFPDSFEETELGEVPKGWRIGTLGNYANLNPESWSKDKFPESIMYVDLANTKWGTIDSTSIYLWKDAPSRAQRVLRTGDTIIGTVRPGNGSYSIISENGLTGSTGFAVLRPKNVDYMPFVYLAVTDKDNIERLAHLADGGAYPAIRPDVVLATPVVYANIPVLECFARAVKPLIDKIEENKRESRTLAELRDTLLPKLISGELRLRETEGSLELDI